MVKVGWYARPRERNLKFVTDLHPPSLAGAMTAHDRLKRVITPRELCSLQQQHMIRGRDGEDPTRDLCPVISASWLGKGSPSELSPTVPAPHLWYYILRRQRDIVKGSSSVATLGSFRIWIQGRKTPQETRHTGKNERAQARATQPFVSDRPAKRGSSDFRSRG